MLSQNFKKTSHKKKRGLTSNFIKKTNSSPTNDLKITDKLHDWKRQLQGGRFRQLNEWLYTHTGSAAYRSFQKQPELFAAYHEGYKKQLSQWPLNPLNLVTTYIKKQPKNWRIGDFGCGDAELAKQIPNKTVYSFDLIANNERVTACNIVKVPLENGSIDAAVFCLSLMGTDWPDYLIESRRCLIERGKLIIVEVSSRINNLKHFQFFVGQLGFDHKKTEDVESFFKFLIFEKNQKPLRSISKHNLENDQDCKSRILKPCLYKKR